MNNSSRNDVSRGGDFEVHPIKLDAFKDDAFKNE